MQAIAFGYKCQECGEGTVREQVVPEYPTKVKGYPFIVKDARIGVCDRCGAEHFASQETDRWERLFEAQYEKVYLQPKEIQKLRKDLGLTMEQFAFLVGCTRQSLYNWERPDRSRPQSRMADLSMKLVRESYEKGKVDVLRFLAEEAERFGIHVRLRGHNGDPSPEPIVLQAEMVPRGTLSDRFATITQLAANTEEEEKVAVLKSENGERVGRLYYDSSTASLELEFAAAPNFDLFDAEVRFKDRQVEKAKAVLVQNKRVKLLEKTRRTEDEVAEVVLYPSRAETGQMERR